jgi:IclR family KDG regulon transcriptional repressor
MRESKSAVSGTGDVRVLDKALDIVLTFSRKEPELGPTDVAQRLGMPRSTVHRVMLTLARRGFLERDEVTGRYRLGAVFLLLASQVEMNHDLRRAAMPQLRELQASTGEAVNLNIVYEGERLCIEKIDSQHALRSQIQVGSRAPLWSAGPAKVLLAFLPDHEQERVLLRFAESGDGSHPDPAELRRELVEIRRLDYAVSSGELVPGVASAAAPLRDHTGEVVAAISVGGPLIRFTPARMPDLIEATVRAARLISARLGYLEGR